MEATTVLNSVATGSQNIFELRRLNNLSSGVGLLLRIEAENDGGFDTLLKTGSINLSSTNGLKSLRLRVYSTIYDFDENGNLTVHLGNSLVRQFLKGVNFSVSSYNWSNTGTLPYVEIIYKALQLNLTDKITILLQDGADGPIHLVLDAFESDGVITMTYFANGKLLKAVVDSTAETITIEEGILSLLSIGDELIYRPTFYIEAPAGRSWDNANTTFSIPGIYSKLKTVLDLNADVALTYPSRQVVIATDLQSFGDGQDIVITYRFSSRRFSLTIKSDDSMTIISAAYIWRFNATDYGFANWSSASGTNQTLYNDLRKLINGNNNEGGLLGYLCDSSNVFVITNICISGGTLEVGFHDAHSNVDRLLSINPSGQYNVLDVSTVRNTFSAIDIGVDTFYPTSNKSYSGLTDFATQFIRLAQSGMPVFLKTKNNQLSTSEDALVPIMNVIWSSGSVTAYYLKVESSRIGRFSISVTSKGNVTINTLGS